MATTIAAMPKARETKKERKRQASSREQRSPLIQKIARTAASEYGIPEEEAARFAEDYLKKVKHYRNPETVRELLQKLRRAS